MRERRRMARWPWYSFAGCRAGEVRDRGANPDDGSNERIGVRQCEQSGSRGISGEPPAGAVRRRRAAGTIAPNTVYSKGPGAARVRWTRV
jgi:hypothetical protein